MKYTIQFILLLFIIFPNKNVFCQIAWAHESAKWKYIGNSAADPQLVEITYMKDTTILNQDAKVFLKKSYTYNSISDSIVVNTIGTEITYEKDSVVYLYTNQNFDTLYSFNSVIGDSWNLQCKQEYCNENIKVTLLDTGTISINEMSLRYITVEYNFDAFYDDIEARYQDTIVERVGPLYLYFLPWDIVSGQIDEHEGGTLQCYSDNQLGSYFNYEDQRCGNLLSLNVSSVDKINIYPNPSSKYLYFNFNEHDQREIVFYSISGEPLTKHKIISRNCSIDISDLPKGVILITINTSNEVYFHKFIKN